MRFIEVCGMAAAGGMAWAQGWQLADKPALKADASLAESYDSNVYLQNTDPGTAGALPAHKHSWVTTVTPHSSLDYKPDNRFGFAAAYAPDVVVYHDAHCEDHATQRLGLTLDGGAKNVVWEQANTFILIDGSNLVLQRKMGGLSFVSFRAKRGIFRDISVHH